MLPPAPRLQAELRALGVEVSLEQAGRAMKAEIGFYRGHLWMGRDAAGLAELRRRCAAVLRDALELELDLGTIEAALLAAIRFEPFPDTVPALRALRAAGVKLVAASNWDVSLHEQLERTGLTPLLDGALDVEADVGGALAAGLQPVLIDRDGSIAPPPGVRRIASLAELPALCA